MSQGIHHTQQRFPTTTAQSRWHRRPASQASQPTENCSEGVRRAIRKRPEVQGPGREVGTKGRCGHLPTPAAPAASAPAAQKGTAQDG